jgi:phage terminase small subunit
MPDTDPKLLAKAGRPFGLTFKEIEFCAAYVTHGKAEKAAIEAGYSEKYAKNAYRLLRKENVAAFIKQRILERFDAERMENGEILARLARLARFDPRQLQNEDGTYKALSELDEATAYGLRGMETDLILGQEAEDQAGQGAVALATRKYKFSDPLPALKVLAQVGHLLDTGNQQISVFIDLDSRLDAARRRKALANQNDPNVVSDQ